jgi:hypothetical protein
MRTALLSLLLIACGGTQHDKTPPPAPDATPRLVMDEPTARETAAGLLEVLATMADITEQRAGDCPTMAAELGTLFDQSAPLFEIVEAAKLDADASRLLGEAMKEHELAVPPLVDRIGKGLDTCRGDPEVGEVMQRMPVI